MNPADEPGIRDRLLRFHEVLDRTHARIDSTLSEFAGQSIVVFHPAFGYFTRRYGLVQLAVEDEGKAPTARRLATVVASLENQKVQAIFIQPQFSDSAARRVADALGCALVDLDPLSEDYVENLETMASRIAKSLADRP